MDAQFLKGGEVATDVEADIKVLEQRIEKRAKTMRKLSAQDSDDQRRVEELRAMLVYLRQKYGVPTASFKIESGALVVMAPTGADGVMNCAQAIDHILKTSPEPIDAETIHARIAELGPGRVTGGSTLVVVRTHLSKNRAAYGWQRTPTRPARWFVSSKGALVVSVPPLLTS